MNKLFILACVVLIAGCVSSVMSDNKSLPNKTTVIVPNNSVINTSIKLTNYTFYVTVPLNTPLNDSVNITFFSDVDWQLWKPMTRINNSVWMFSMPAGWLPNGATRISYGFSRNGHLDKTELLSFDNYSFWINRSFPSNKSSGLVMYDVVKSWRDIVTLSPDDLIKGSIYAIVPFSASKVNLTSKGVSYELSKVNDSFFSINLSLYYNSSFTLTAYYTNGSVINSNSFLFDREVFAYISESGVGRDLMKGYTFSASHYGPVSYSRGTYLDKVNESFDLMKSEGVTWVNFIPVWFLTDIYSSDLRPIYREEYGIEGWSGWMYATIPDEEVRLMIRWAHDRGLKVFLMPHLSTLNWSESVPGKGSLAPRDVDSFFMNYTYFQTHYARIAQEEGVELYSIGNELDSVTIQDNLLSTGYNKDSEWRVVISAVRGVYSGNLTYSCACTHNDASLCTPELISFWDALDVIGFEWYIPLTSSTVVSMSELISDAKVIIDSKINPLSTKYGKSVVLTEYGWEAKPFAWSKSYGGGSQGNFDKYAAVISYEAVFEALKDEPKVIGMFINTWPLGDKSDLDYLDDYNGLDTRFSIIEPEIAKWYSYFN